jgi:hypothetical protein
VSAAAFPLVHELRELAGRVGSGTEQVEKRARCHDRDAPVLAEGRETAIAGYDMTRPALESRSDVLVVIGIVADTGEFPFRDHIGQDDEVLEPELSVYPSHNSTHLPIPERSQNLLDDGRREHDLEISLTQESLDEAPWRSCGLDDRADVDVRVEDGAEQCYLVRRRGFRTRLRAERCAPSAISSACPSVTELCFCFSRTSSMPPSEPSHLLQPLDWDQRSQRLAFPLDHELVTA